MPDASQTAAGAPLSLEADFATNCTQVGAGALMMSLLTIEICVVVLVAVIILAIFGARQTEHRRHPSENVAGSVVRMVAAEQR